jgi:hypothetical protein
VLDYRAPKEVEDEVMSIRFTAVEFYPTGHKSHEAISRLELVDEMNAAKTGVNTKADLVSFVDRGGKAYCGKGSDRVAVLVRREVGKQPYLQSVADGKWANNLLALPLLRVGASH